MDGVDHSDFHIGDRLRTAFVHGRYLLDAFFLKPHAQFKDADSYRIELLADLNRIANVIAVPVSAEHGISFLDILFAFRACGISGDPRIDIESLPFRSLNA